jgi:hypothetical protein
MLNGASYTTGGASKGPGEFWEIRNTTGAAMSITTSDSVLIFQLGGNRGEVGGGVIPQLDCTGSQSVSVVRSGLSSQNFVVTILVKQVDQNNFTSNVAGAAAALNFTNVGSTYAISQINYGATADGVTGNNLVSLGGVVNFTNSTGFFHLGVTSGGGGVTRIGYFSNFGSVSGEIQNLGTTVCENGKARLEVSIPGGASSYQWSRDGVILPEFTGDSVLTCRSGNFKVVATTNSGCNGTFEFPLNFSRCRYTCVDKIRVSLNGKCQDTLQLIEAVLPSDCLEAPDYFLVVNDANPSNGAVIDGISPVDGWTYGVFLNLDNGMTELVCQGRVIVTDDLGPIFTPVQKTAWETIDTIVTWADNLDPRMMERINIIWGVLI